jgi:perosamine synthetase
MIPVSRPYLDEEEVIAIREVFDSRWLGLGAKVKEFEDKVCSYLGAPRFLATNTGTTAIHLALRALGIGKGDEVIVPSFTFVASVQAITASGAKPVFCDINSDTLNISIESVKSVLSAKTKAILPVHYRGEACDMNKLLDLANKHDLYIIEDAAHAFGSKYKDKMIGSFGHVTCFSFDPIKNITCGEGGGIVFQNHEHHEKAEKMRILGIDTDTWARYQNKRNWQYDVVCEGYRYHMPNFCAAIGIKQLERIDKTQLSKINICKQYDKAFSNLKSISIRKMDYTKTNPFMYIVLAENRDEFMKYLNQAGIGSGIHYIPAHVFKFYRKNKKSDLQVTDFVSARNTSLPLYYGMTDSDVKAVISAVIDYDRGVK